ncbi:hypothetical protein [Petrimonas sp.]|uniref:hypothetical protein n=1 Tax=Petrimonas sp. TaxID=2023866 RepID=UPI003F516E2B
MEKKYKYYFTKSEKFLLGFVILFYIAIIVWAILNVRYEVIFYFLPSIAILFTLVRFYRLTDDNMLVMQRYFFGSAFKPISVNQIKRIMQRKKNKTILIYNRDGLRGDIILKLSDTDLKDFLDELKRRNPAIEISN